MIIIARHRMRLTLNFYNNHTFLITREAGLSFVYFYPFFGSFVVQHCVNVGWCYSPPHVQTYLNIQREQQAIPFSTVSQHKRKKKKNCKEAHKNVSRTFYFDLKRLCAFALREKQIFPFSLAVFVKVWFTVLQQFRKDDSVVLYMVW